MANLEILASGPSFVTVRIIRAVRPPTQEDIDAAEANGMMIVSPISVPEVWIELRADIEDITRLEYIVQELRSRLTAQGGGG